MIHEPRDIPRRRIDFDFSPTSVPRKWCRDDLFLSLFNDALSLVFPEGERFFVTSVRRYRDRIHDPALRASVAGFIGQEAMHGKEHRAFNEALRAQGLDTAPLEAHVTKVLRIVRKTAPPIVQLAVTCALEHFTAMLAEQLLSQEEPRASMHPSVRPLWLWHALEESEHKAVAFDVYKVVGGGYVVRAATMIVTSIVFVAEVSHLHARLLAGEGELFRPMAWLRGMDFLWRKPGVFRKLILPYLDYFRPGFHPNDRDTKALLDAWRERLFGVDGVLTQQLVSVTRADAA